MSNEAELKQRFGLKESKSRHGGPESDLVPAMSGHRLDKFIQEFDALDLNANLRTHDTSMRRRVRWVIRDKAKSETLVKELAHFVTELN